MHATKMQYKLHISFIAFFLHTRDKCHNNKQIFSFVQSGYFILIEYIVFNENYSLNLFV